MTSPRSRMALTAESRYLARSLMLLPTPMYAVSNPADLIVQTSRLIARNARSLTPFMSARPAPDECICNLDDIGHRLDFVNPDHVGAAHNRERSGGGIAINCSVRRFIKNGSDERFSGWTYGASDSLQQHPVSRGAFAWLLGCAGHS